MCGETWWDEFGDTWGERCGWWTCTVWAGGTLALAFGLMLTGVGWTLEGVVVTFMLFPVWIAIWAILAAILFLPVLLVGAVLSVFLDELQHRLERAPARASADDAPAP